jgi:4-hydroxysphinganine ceramide fatty acyl 2-hydroxylase
MDLIDLTKPLVPQIRKLNKKQYLSWVHNPHVVNFKIYGMKQARLFKSDFCEAFSYTNWYSIPLMWIPISLYFWSFYIKSLEELYDPYIYPKIFALLFAGYAVWSFLEYSVHRFLFHLDSYLPDWKWALQLHFLTHGVHHKLPTDPYRLVMPPVMFGILSTIAYFIFKKLLFFIPNDLFMGWFGSTLLSYVYYDLSHYSQHHNLLTLNSYMNRYHRKHHFMPYGHELGFGITTIFWDKVFGTKLNID